MEPTAPKSWSTSQTPRVLRGWRGSARSSHARGPSAGKTALTTTTTTTPLGPGRRDHKGSKGGRGRSKHINHLAPGAGISITVEQRGEANKDDSETDDEVVLFSFLAGGVPVSVAAAAAAASAGAFSTVDDDDDEDNNDRCEGDGEKDEEEGDEETGDVGDDEEGVEEEHNRYSGVVVTIGGGGGAMASHTRIVESRERGSSSVDVTETQARPVCKYLLRGHCSKGASCRFSHDVNVEQSVEDADAATEGEDANHDGDVYEKEEEAYNADADQGEEDDYNEQDGETYDEETGEWDDNDDDGDGQGVGDTYEGTAPTVLQCEQCEGYRDADCANGCCVTCCSAFGRAQCFAEGHGADAHVQERESYSEAGVAGTIDPRWCVGCGNNASIGCANNACKRCCAESEVPCDLPKHRDAGHYVERVDSHDVPSKSVLHGCQHCGKVAGKTCDYWCCRSCCLQRTNGGECSQHGVP